MFAEMKKKTVSLQGMGTAHMEDFSGILLKVQHGQVYVFSQNGRQVKQRLHVRTQAQTEH